jgi:flagellar hook-associated protein 1 FlgK
MAGLFDTFTVAKRGLAVQQSNINTSSHNIANAQTEGYSRQRSVAHTTRPFGGMSRFDSCIAGQVGTGVEVTGIMRIRDSFLDYQVRTQNTSYGSSNVRNEYLTQVEDILNETSDNGVQTYLSKFYNAFQTLSTSSGSTKESNRTVAFKAAQQLADLLNSKYKQIENKQSDAQKQLRNQTTDINTILDQVNELSKEISSVCAIGMTPNDLMDSRDLLIDKLSSKFGITIDKEPRETMNLSVTEDSDIGNLVNAEPSDDNYVRFSYVESVEYVQTGVDGSGNPTYDYTKLNVKYAVLGDQNKQKTMTITATDATEAKKLKEDLMKDRMLVADKDGNVVATSSTSVAAAAGTPEGKVSTIAADGTGTIIETKMVNGTLTTITTTKTAITTAAQLDKQIFNNVTKGEIAATQQVEDDMDSYMENLNKFAASFAYAVNAIQTGSRGATSFSTDTGIVDKTGNKIAAVNIFVTKNADGTISATDTGITAKNITFNTVLEKNPAKLNCGKYSVDDYSGEGDGSRALAIADLANLKINIGDLSLDDISTRDKFFSDTGLKFDTDGLDLTTNKEGSKLSDYYGSILSKIYSENQKAVKDASASKELLNTLDTQRQSVSGVSLDEEMTDLIQFQHAYQANAKMINTIDQLLDVVINGLKA